MSLNTLSAPKESIEALASVINKLRDGTDEMALKFRFLAKRNLAGAKESLHHKVYFMGLSDVVAGKGIETAEFMGWRYIASSGKTKISVDMGYDAKDQRHFFHSLNENPFVAETVSRIALARKNRNVHAGSYELRVLEIPALYIVAIWLKDEKGSNDILVPLEPTHPALKAGSEYDSKTFFLALEKPAAEVLGFDDSPRKPARRNRERTRFENHKSS